MGILHAHMFVHTLTCLYNTDMHTLETGVCILYTPMCMLYTHHAIHTPCYPPPGAYTLHTHMCVYYTHPTYTHTGQSHYLDVGAWLVYRLNSSARGPCGFASVGDVSTGVCVWGGGGGDGVGRVIIHTTCTPVLYTLPTSIEHMLSLYPLLYTVHCILHIVHMLHIVHTYATHATHATYATHAGRLEDTQESFFLSETLKYLYLLFSNASSLLDHVVMTTEGHVMYPGVCVGGGGGGYVR